MRWSLLCLYIPVQTTTGVVLNVRSKRNNPWWSRISMYALVLLLGAYMIMFQNLNQQFFACSWFFNRLLILYLYLLSFLLSKKQDTFFLQWKNKNLNVHTQKNSAVGKPFMVYITLAMFGSIYILCTVPMYIICTDFSLHFKVEGQLKKVEDMRVSGSFSQLMLQEQHIVQSRRLRKRSRRQFICLTASNEEA